MNDLLYFMQLYAQRLDAVGDSRDKPARCGGCFRTDGLTILTVQSDHIRKCPTYVNTNDVP
jgi:hypothetical protein